MSKQANRPNCLSYLENKPSMVRKVGSYDPQIRLTNAIKLGQSRIHRNCWGLE